MSNRVARKVTPQLWHTPTTTVGPWGRAKVHRQRRRRGRRARRGPTGAWTRARNPVNPSLDRRLLHDSLRDAPSRRGSSTTTGRIVGHLYGALLGDRTYGDGVWIGPDGVSFDDPDVLAASTAQPAPSGSQRGALEHYVWCVDDDSRRLDPGTIWASRACTCAACSALGERGASDLPPAATRFVAAASADLDRRGRARRRARRRPDASGPSFSIRPDHATKREELLETLEDPEVHHYVVEHDGRVVAQCITFPLAARGVVRSSSTLHLSAVTVARGTSDAASRTRDGRRRARRRARRAVSRTPRRTGA